MTTIAWDGRHLAGDGVVMTGSEDPVILQDDFRKIGLGTCLVRTGFRREKREVRAWGGAGHLGWVVKFGKHWLSGGEGRPEMKFEEGDTDQFHMISVRGEISSVTGNLIGDLLVQEWDQSEHVYTLDRPFAIGVGRKYCLAAMRHGATAMEALVTAKSLDPWTGGVLTYADLHDWRAGVRVYEK